MKKLTVSILLFLSFNVSFIKYTYANDDPCIASYSKNEQLHIPCISIEGIKEIFQAKLKERKQGSVFELDASTIKQNTQNQQTQCTAIYIPNKQVFLPCVTMISEDVKNIFQLTSHLIY